MSERFTVDLLPALEGDALWVEWGDDTRRGRMLIDGGRGSTSRLSKRLATVLDARPDQREFDVVVCSHMDVDHIAGLIGLFRDPPDGFVARDIWFNGLRHVIEFDDGLGINQSDDFEEVVEDYVTTNGTGWNQGLGAGTAIVVRPAERPAEPTDSEESPPIEQPPVTIAGTEESPPIEQPPVTIAGTEESPPLELPSVTIAGMTITLVSPSVDRMSTVAGEWPELVRREAAELAALNDEDSSPAEGGAESEDEFDDGLGFDADAGVDPEELVRRPYEPDDSAANGASIAFIAEFGGKRVLFAADAHAEVLEQSLRAFQPDGRIEFDAVKLSHHGSEKNLSPGLLDLISCPTWLISTNGSRHHHPDRRAIARIVTRAGPTFLVFNYDSSMSSEWGRASMAHRFGYRAHVPAKDRPGVRYDVMTDNAMSLT
jgi:hypothetical protein